MNRTAQTPDELMVRLEALERRLSHLCDAIDASVNDQWVDARTFCELVGLRDTRALVYQMSKGVLGGNAVRNIGTVKRPRYRFHRVWAVDQFLNRSVGGPT